MTGKNDNNWKVTEDNDGIVWLHLDKVDSKTNVLSARVLQEFADLIHGYSQSPPRGLVILSDKESGFIAGADVKEFNNFHTEEEAREAIERGHAIMNQLESLPCPTVAVLHGYTLGGGLELALVTASPMTISVPSWAYRKSNSVFIRVSVVPCDAWNVSAHSRVWT